MKLYPALFLDRDGVINVDHAYVFESKNFEFIEGIFELCRAAKNHDYFIFVVTNQAGIARGYYTEDDFWRLTEWMLQIFKDQKISIDKVYFCPFHAQYGVGKYQLDSIYRKPKPGMILQAAREFPIDLSRSLLIGDKLSDIEAGMAAGVADNLLYDSKRMFAQKSPKTTVITHLREAIAFL